MINLLIMNIFLGAMLVLIIAYQIKCNPYRLGLIRLSLVIGMLLAIIVGVFSETIGEALCGWSCDLGREIPVMFVEAGVFLLPFIVALLCEFIVAGFKMDKENRIKDRDNAGF